MPLDGTLHFSFTVSNLERSVDFYVNKLGLSIASEMERKGDDIASIVALPDAHLKICFIKLPPQGEVLLELIEYVWPHGQTIDKQTCNVGSGHIAFRVNDIHATYQEMKARGVQFKSEPVEIVQGVNKGAWAVYFRDPDGLTLEMIQPARK